MATKNDRTKLRRNPASAKVGVDQPVQPHETVDARPTPDAREPLYKDDVLDGGLI